MKTCTNCKAEKPLNEFSARKLSKDGLMTWCKPCMKAYHAEKRADPVALEKKRAAGLAYYYENKDAIAVANAEKYVANKDAIRARNVAWQKANPERYAAAVAAYAKANPEKRRAAVAAYRERNPEKVKAYAEANRERANAKSKKWAAENRDRVNDTANAYRRKQYAENDIYAMQERVRAAVRAAFRNNGLKKNCRTLEILGCTWPQFIAHIESQFWPGMTWDNRDRWHIDHRVPISTAKCEDDIIRLNHHTNLQPLWAPDNQAKGNRLNHPLGAICKS